LEDQQEQKKSFKFDAAKVWNKAPERIRTSRNIPNCQKGDLTALQFTAHLGNTFLSSTK
jgi:hypothetical protein